jgi:large subunit ribosomal protein L4
MSDVAYLRGPVKKERPAPVVRTVTRRNFKGEVLGSVELAPSYFGIEPNTAVLHQVITAQLAAARAGTQSTKTRSEVRGGGRKPFRQKGTGGARQGTIRAPHYPGGGIALGPKPRKYTQKTPKKMVALALRSALSDRAANGQIALVDRYDFEGPCTHDAKEALTTLGLTGKVLIVIADSDVNTALSFRNLQEAKCIQAHQLNAYDVLLADWLLFSDETLLNEEAN